MVLYAAVTHDCPARQASKWPLVTGFLPTPALLPQECGGRGGAVIRHALLGEPTGIPAPDHR